MISLKLNTFLQVYWYIFISSFVISCGSDTTNKDLKEALTFYASFDNGVNADFALGDPQLYTVPSRNARDSAKVGLHKEGISISKANGLKGDALHYNSNNKGYIYYTSKNNIIYSKEKWNGAISFWLNLDPATDLKPGYCDPIQITDVSYNDASIWVDFTKENPRDFRLGVIGDKTTWKKDTTVSDNDDKDFISQLIPVAEPPFQKGSWTHILINFKNLNTNKGETSLYINGQLKGNRKGISDPFTWELDKSNIYLGLGYIGLMDELSIYDRDLSQKEITTLYTLENGVHTLLK
ncbi:LamG-like jellyroll fold domain-containing protein [Aquimarina sp. SS2-1]|uniref:LamG-like jellyroll fold domain-containing protein n=1 Tax=Aquimarina besae TaxID=3342247 RepID=UPI0036714E5A